MDSFEYRGGELYAEGVSAERLAEEFGTPLYVYSAATIRDHYGKIAEAFREMDPVICYSVKANGNLAVLKLLADAGAGFDVVSGGELYRALRVGGEAQKIAYAGVGKTRREMREALEAGILMFNVESAPELAVLNEVAGEAGESAPVALRVNPDVEPGTHDYVATGRKETKFGISFDAAADVLARAADFPNVRFRGLHLHIGSQITEVAPYEAALAKAVAFIKAHRSERAPLDWLDTGGGFGIFYQGNEARDIADFASVIVPAVREAGCHLVLEPGRFIIGNAGVLLARVLYVKQTPAKRFVITDAAMNDLVRPSLYSAYHEIWPARAGLLPPSRGGAASASLEHADIVGPVCESGDFLAKDRPFPKIAAGELVAVFSAGAYGFSMSSNYNGRPRAAEVLVEGDTARLVRGRETYENLVRGESS